jgi:hypothetical protein
MGLVKLSERVYQMLFEEGCRWHFAECKEIPNCDCGELHLVPPLEWCSGAELAAVGIEMGAEVEVDAAREAAIRVEILHEEDEIDYAAYNAAMEPGKVKLAHAPKASDKRKAGELYPEYEAAMRKTKLPAIAMKLSTRVVWPDNPEPELLLSPAEEP